MKRGGFAVMIICPIGQTIERESARPKRAQPSHALLAIVAFSVFIIFFPMTQLIPSHNKEHAF